MNLIRFPFIKETKYYSIPIYDKEPSSIKISKIDGGECNITFEIINLYTIPVFEYKKGTYLFKMMFEYGSFHEQVRLAFSTNIVKNENIIFKGKCEENIKDLVDYYFDLNTDYEEIKQKLSNIDEYLKAVGYGIQD